MYLSNRMQNDSTAKILIFLDSIGIPHRMQTVNAKTFVPGIDIENGVLLIDEEKMLYPGDLLHEAGHLAVRPADKRNETTNDVKLNNEMADGEELAAILWSYAALKKIGLNPEVVFHPNGYKGQSDWLIENFESGTYIALPLLEWMGLTADEKKAKEMGIEPFPNMIRWLRE